MKFAPFLQKTVFTFKCCYTLVISFNQPIAKNILY